MLLMLQGTDFLSLSGSFIASSWILPSCSSRQSFSLGDAWLQLAPNSINQGCCCCCCRAPTSYPCLVHSLPAPGSCHHALQGKASPLVTAKPQPPPSAGPGHGGDTAQRPPHRVKAKLAPHTSVAGAPSTLVALACSAPCLLSRGRHLVTSAQPRLAGGAGLLSRRQVVCGCSCLARGALLVAAAL
jgi:hypothetical protein